MIGRGKAEKKTARSERLSAALRENLKRRKAQARSRAGHMPAGDETAADVAPDDANSPDFRRNAPGPRSERRAGLHGCCRSSVVEHPLGKGEVVSSILTGSTTLVPLLKRRKP